MISVSSSNWPVRWTSALEVVLAFGLMILIPCSLLAEWRCSFGFNLDDICFDSFGSFYFYPLSYYYSIAYLHDDPFAFWTCIYNELISLYIL